MRISELLRGGLQLVRGLLRTGKWGVRIESGVRLRGRGNYDLHPGCVIRSHARIYVERGATLTLHPQASIGGRAIVNVRKGLEIGSGTIMSWECQILDSDFHTLVGTDGVSREMDRPIVIGRNVLIGTRALILKGTQVGDGAVIAAGAVVAGRTVPPATVIGGNPGKEIGRISHWVP